MMQSKPALTRSTLWLMTIATGMIVANNYYNQPLLGLMAKDFEVPESQISNIAMLTQIGYAMGLLLLVPLGDLVKRRQLILWDMAAIIISLGGMILAPTVGWLFVASFLVGFTSIAPQLFVPMAAELASKEKQSAAIGMVMSGLLVGILLSRVISGFVGEYLGWKAMYGIAIGFMLILGTLVYRSLPEVHPNFTGSYAELMRSLLFLVRTQPVLRLSAFRGATAFAGFSAFWTTLVFHLEEAPFYAGPSVAGSFGIIGAAGALAAAVVGKIAAKTTPYKIILFSILIMLLSWGIFYVGGYTYFGLIIGIILIDLGLQSMHIMNQSSYFALRLSATNRLNTVYMVSYFIGGSTGTFVGAQAWKHFHWPGVVAAGALFSLLALLGHLFFSPKKSVIQG